MRDELLLLVLDEPTAALDAEIEHALFERYAAAARRSGENGRGRITILVSHRFSTVRMADLMVVLDGARLVEQLGPTWPGGVELSFGQWQKLGRHPR